MIKKRQKEIIHYLLQRNHPVTGRELAEFLNVTGRTVRSDISELNSLSGDMILSGNDGYYIPADSVSYYSSLISESRSSESGIFESQNMREIFLLFQMLWLETGITADELSSVMYESRTTVLKDIRAMKRDFIDSSGLMLVNGRTGVRIEGSEIRKRDLIGKVLFEGYERNDIGTIRQILTRLGIVRNEDFIWLYDFLIGCFSSRNITLSDRGMYLFTLENLILYNRIRCFFCLENRIDTEESIDLSYPVIEEHFDISLDENERSYISARIAVRNQIHTESEMADESVREVINAFISELSSAYRIDSQLLAKNKNGLTSHLTSMINRIRQKIQIDANIINDIRTMYPYAYECSTAIIPILSRVMGFSVSEAEISYIAVHLAVILEHQKHRLHVLILCSSAIGTGMLIKKRLENNFESQISITGPEPVYLLDKVLKEQTDISLIISTVPIEVPSGIDVLRISPVFSEADIRKMQLYLSHHVQRIPQENSRICFSRDLFYIFEDDRDRNAILNTMGRDLERQGYIENADRFIASVQEREKLYSTIYGRIWLPHPMGIFAQKNGISVGIVKNGTAIDLVFMLSIRREDTSLFSSLYNKILELMDEPGKLSQLAGCESFEEFRSLYEKL